MSGLIVQKKCLRLFPPETVRTDNAEQKPTIRKKKRKWSRCISVDLMSSEESDEDNIVLIHYLGALQSVYIFFMA